ncbi:RAD50 DNA repair-like protein [Leishmania mexicana MHOM/GT/2001/U1103]|uniref:DNA repair protein RAD50 n=1 Tax=Leishmania mexicana (strain MHOM/GT/2001/U1103) TaxID=929439 RepID=E9AZL4_LEIMU|nr:RAD50 DNA repair-like protein [Leishmania mexicana MHOM/GT/2001/U1103]CBZ28415.1 RAD50 DNA repair-like protein [Leishmania mexicana MHOM/GT/2001/U1103]
MTSIEKLQLCGVRSFDPNPANQQFIQFQKPLTVILGKNGAGKTTIIEALLNACTGAMPPGSGTEKGSFVYDPKVVGETEVKAQIRLIFTGKGGKLMQVIRSFQATRSAHRVTFTTLDNTVAFQDLATGEVVSSTYRASDVDRVVPEMLGVSPAVLEHVIFCHQEECNWPLGPPKDVKRIFDDIFAATRYVLALDRLRDNSKEFRRQLKEHEASLMALREHREQAKQLEQQIAQKESVVKAIQDRSIGIEPELRGLRQAREALRTVEEQIETLQREVAVTNGRLEERREAVRRMGVPATSQTLEDLLEMRGSFTAQMQQLEEGLVHDTKRHDTAAARRRAQEEEMYKCRSNVQLLEREAQLHKQNVARLRELIQHLSNEYVLSEGNIDERSLQRLLQKAEEAVAVERRRARTTSEGIQQRIRDAEDGVQGSSRAVDGCNKEIEMREHAVENVRRRMKENAAAIAALGGDGCRGQLRQVQVEVEELQQRVAATEELRKKGSGGHQSQRIIMELEEQNSTVAELREEMMQQKLLERQQQDLVLLRQQIDESSAAVAAALQRDVLPILHEVGVQVPQEAAADSLSLTTLTSLRSQAAQVRQLKAEELSALQTRALELEKACALQEQKMSYSADELAQCRRAVDAGTRQCAGLFPDMDAYEGVLLQAREAAETAVQKRHALEALASCYHDFMVVAKEEKTCAVCERPFDSDDSLESFLTRKADRQRTSPEALAAVQATVTAAQEAYQSLEKLQSVVVTVRQNRHRIPVLEVELNALEDKMKQSCAEQREVCATRDAAQHVVHQLDTMYQHLCMVCTMGEKTVALRDTLARKEKDFEAAQAEQQQQETQRKGGSGDGATARAEPPQRSYEELCEAYAAATERLHKLNRQFTEAQRMERGQDENAAERELQERKAAMLQAEVAVAKLEDLEAAVRELQEEAAQHRTRVEELKRQAAEAQRSVEAHQQRVLQLRAEFQKTEAAERGALDTAETQLRELQLSLPPVLRYVQNGCARQLEELRVHLHETESAYKAAAQEEEGLASRMKEARETLSDQHRRSADMDRHIDVLQQEASIAADEAHLAETERTLASLKSDRLQEVEQLLGKEARQASLATLREMITAKITSLEKIRAQQDGNTEAMLLDVNQLKQQLRGDKYQNIEKRYRSTFLKVQTTEISIQDIEKYYSALEKAVQSYHQEKIAQINQIIAELWRQTYRGSDVDTVEIRSETEGTTTTAARRSYNYRVVMKRGNNEMDMRGRCSAGQKVLASIIIRLALSEAFCCDCGILALDEPTTNLDDDNARSLADALRTLIQARRAVKHFQLVVITHDEQFVRALGGQSLEKFYYVLKDREGAFSVIDERTFDQLFA